jgi:hypothetical protein
MRKAEQQGSGHEVIIAGLSIRPELFV